jgi:hypothetical protein
LCPAGIAGAVTPSAALGAHGTRGGKGAATDSSTRGEDTASASGAVVAKDGVTYGESTETAAISVGITARASVSAYAAYVPDATVTGATETNVAATVPWASVTLAVTLDARSVWLW